VKLLVDSHVVVWLLQGEPIAARAQALLDSLDNDVWVSVATIWELEIKRAIGKLALDDPQDLESAVLAAGLDLLEIRSDHATLAARLPLHHRDPFDRLLIAQATIEGFALVTRDALFQRYAVTLIDA
jgi:PIN domain nuclease of toxin-antitoxin system